MYIRSHTTTNFRIFDVFLTVDLQAKLYAKYVRMYVYGLSHYHISYYNGSLVVLTLILRRSRTGTVWFYTSTNNKRVARPKLYTKSLTRDLKRMYSRFTLVRISINL